MNSVRALQKMATADESSGLEEEMSRPTDKQLGEIFVERRNLQETDPRFVSREALQFALDHSTEAAGLQSALSDGRIKPETLAHLLAGRLVPRTDPAIQPISSTPVITVPKPRRILTPDKVRRAQAKRLFSLGFNHGVRGTTAKTLAQYLAGIPPIPDFLFKEDQELFLLPLADPRPGLTKACSLIGIRYAEFGYNDGSAEPWDDRHRDPTEPFWFRCHDGRPNRGVKPEDCRAKCVGNRLVGTAMTGIMAFVHHPNLVIEGEHVADLPGSVNRDARARCAFLEVWSGQPRLLLNGDAWDADPSDGSLVLRREC